LTLFPIAFAQDFAWCNGGLGRTTRRPEGIRMQRETFLLCMSLFELLIFILQINILNICLSSVPHLIPLAKIPIQKPFLLIDARVSLLTRKVSHHAQKKG
jgi:hypothetical protein